MNSAELITLIVIPLAFLAGWVYGEVRLLRKISELKLDLNGELKRAEDDLSVKLTGKMIRELKHEIIDGIHYFFTADTDEFVVQGVTLDDAAVNYIKMHGNGALCWFHHSDTGKEYYFKGEHCVEYGTESV